MSERTNWKSVTRPDAGRVRDVVEDEARITAFRELVYQLRVDAGLTKSSWPDGWARLSLRSRGWRTVARVRRWRPWNASLAPLIKNSRSWSARG
jgi:hypothetical protein